MSKKWLTGIIALAGLGLAGLAFFANQFGLDLENNWGRGRVIVAVTGLSLILISSIIVSWKFWVDVSEWVKRILKGLVIGFLELPAIRRSLRMIQSRWNSWRARWTRTLFARWVAARIKNLRDSRPVRYFAGSQGRMAALATGVLGVAITVIYIWFVSVGYWRDWPKTTTYYNQLADAFLHGQTHLLIEPAPELLALDDPYNYENRKNIAQPWDTVFYDGKFYLYWGPAPALILALVKAIYPAEIGDQVLVFAFVLGTWLFTALLILRARNRLFSNLRWTYVIPAISLAGLANPLPWLLNRPEIYEAAIAGGQFFLMAGLYWGFDAVGDQRRRNFKLSLAAFCWVLALSSRLSLAPAALFLILMTAWYLLQRSQLQKRGKIFSLSALLIPFAAGLGGLGWYNKIRFGSLFEFGNRYQLSGINVHAIYDQVFSPANIPINLHNYFLNPFRTLSTFPYIKPDWGGRFIFFPINSSPEYYSEQVSGLLLTTPYILLAVIPIVYLLRLALQHFRQVLIKKPAPHSNVDDRLLNWTTITLSGTCLMAFGPVLLFIAGTMRYLADVIPLLIVISTLGFWMAVRHYDEKTPARGRLVLLVVLITTVSLIVSILLAVTSYQARFEHLNPILFDKLTRLLTP